MGDLVRQSSFSTQLRLTEFCAHTLGLGSILLPILWDSREIPINGGHERVEISLIECILRHSEHANREHALSVIVVI